MPNPSDFSDQDSFMAECVPMAVSEGNEHDQAVAMCSAMWEQREMQRSNGELTCSRLMRLQGVNPDAGTFSMTLVTEGETADGHIVSIEGASLPPAIPLLVSHINDPKQAVGSIVRMRKHLNESPPRISAVGEVELEGEGTAAEIRRDLMHMISKGHIHAVSMSGAAERGGVIPRADLSREHPYHVDLSREPFASPRRRGFYFKNWKASEGSIVAVGADPRALIGRADATQGDVSSFWRSFAEHTEAPKIELPEPPPEAMLAAFAAQVREFTEKGIPLEKLERILSEGKKSPAEQAVDALLARLDAIERKLTALDGRVSGEPAAPPTTIETLRSVLDGIRQDRKAGLAKLREELAKSKGKVSHE